MLAKRIDILRSLSFSWHHATTKRFKFEAAAAGIDWMDSSSVIISTTIIYITPRWYWLVVVVMMVAAILLLFRR
jgi:hypothetical protein